MATKYLLILAGFIISILSFIVSYAQDTEMHEGEELYLHYCATCHGDDGYGTRTRAPAIRNPLLFGIEPITSQTQRLLEIDNHLSNQLRPEKLELELTADLSEEQETRLDNLWQEEAILEAERTEILQARVGFIQTFRLYVGVSEELMAQFGDVEQANNSFSEAYDNFNQHIYRLFELDWNGNLNSYLYSVIGFGINADVYESNQTQNHAFSVTAGGSLSDNEISSIIEHIMTWDKDWQARDIVYVRQYPIPAVPYYLQPTPTPQPTNGREAFIDRITNEVVSSIDDPKNGEALYSSVMYACVACHSDGSIGITTEDMWSIVVEERLGLEQFNGYSPERYIVESILEPNAYVADDQVAGMMPHNYAERLYMQDLIDIIAYLKYIGAQ